MSATYWMLVSDALFADEDTTWPPGMEPVLPPDLREFSDEDADPELDGHKVSVTVRKEHGRVLTDRRMIE